MIDDVLIQRIIGLAFFAAVISILKRLFSDGRPPVIQSQGGSLVVASDPPLIPR